MRLEDQQRYRVYLVPFARNDAQLGILHDQCPSRWHAEETDFVTLAELNQEHAEVCR